jgi:membrane protease YdiL (CAAX protease family)
VAPPAVADTPASVPATNQPSQVAPQPIVPPDDPFNAGVSFLDKGNPVEAAKMFRQSADQGNVRAEVKLAYLLRHGMGVPKDLKLAADWDLKAANMGDPAAQRDLGIAYMLGEGVAPNDQKAFDWFYHAARQDDPVAEHYLAYLYRNGRGVARDDTAAFRWYYRSAEQGNSNGECGLASMYEFGRGVPQDDTAAFDWDYAAAQHGNHFGEYALGYMYQAGRGVKKDRLEALKWYKRAQIGFPNDEKLKRAIFSVGLREFLENPSSGAFDLSTIPTALRWQLILVMYILTAIYIAGVVILLVYSFMLDEGPVHPALALGWIVLYVESQAVAFLALCLFGKWLDADSLMFLTVLLGALPVVASTLAPNRRRMWQESPVPGGTIFLNVLRAYIAVIVLNAVYHAFYSAIVHSALPVQPTHTLITKTKGGSPALAYIVFAMVIPVAEEILFRGYLFGAVKRSLSDGYTVIITAFAFALFHGQPLHFVPLLTIGLALGWLRLKTRSLRVPMLMHAFNNWVALLHVA